MADTQSSSPQAEAAEAKGAREKAKAEFEREAKKPGRYIVEGNLVDANSTVVLPVPK